MRFLIVGCGSVGKRHLINLSNLGVDVVVCDISKDRLSRIQKGHKYMMVFQNIEEALSQELDAVVICTPTSMHIPVAIAAARKQLHCFIEKPLSNTLQGVDELLELTWKNQLTILVGCNMRFLPSLAQLKTIIDSQDIGRIIAGRISVGYYLPYWHPYEDYRKGYSASGKLGGGVIFDWIHEIDYLRWVFGEVEEVFCYMDKLSDLEIDTEDIAEILLRFKSGLIVQLHFDYIQRTYRRYYEFIGEKGVAVWDYIKRELRVCQEKPYQWKIYGNDINLELNQMYIEEMKHFINCLLQQEKPMNDISSAKKTLQIVLAAKKSAGERRFIKL